MVLAVKDDYVLQQCDLEATPPRTCCSTGPRPQGRDGAWIGVPACGRAGVPAYVIPVAIHDLMPSSVNSATVASDKSHAAGPAPGWPSSTARSRAT